MSVFDLFRRKKRSTMPEWAAAREWLTWEAPINFIREGHHQDAIHEILGARSGREVLVPVDVLLMREAGNQYDENAIRAHVAGRLIGYVRRELAAELAPQLDAAGVDVFMMPGVIRGGMPDGDEPMYGVHVWPRGAIAEKPVDLSFSIESDLLVYWPPVEAELIGTGWSQRTDDEED